MRDVEQVAREARRLRTLRGIANWTIPVYLGVLVVLTIFFGPYVSQPAVHVPLTEVVLLLAVFVPLGGWLVVWLRFQAGYFKCPACGACFPDPDPRRRRWDRAIPAECWFCHYSLVTGGAPSNNALERTRHE